MAKTKPQTKPSEGGLLSRLKYATDPREPGWQTLDELLADTPMPRTTARRLLNDAIAAGVVESRKFKCATRNGVKTVLNYREKKS